MVDFNGSSAVGGNPSKLSSQEYLEQLRQRRQQRYQTDANQADPSQNIAPSAEPTPTPQPITVPVYTPPVIEPTHAQAIQPNPVEPAPSFQPVAASAAEPTPISSPSPQSTQPQNPTPASEKPEPEDFATNENEMAYDQADFYGNPMKPIKEELVLEWESPSRPFKKRNRQFFSTIAIIALLISLILFFAGQVLIIAVVISVVFLGYVLATVPPDNIKHRITTYGINSDGILYYWDELGRFWFDTKMGQRLVSIETDRFPIRIILLLGDQPEELIRDILSEVLLEERPIPSTLEKMATWLEEKIPLETS